MRLADAVRHDAPIRPALDLSRLALRLLDLGRWPSVTRCKWLLAGETRQALRIARPRVDRRCATALAIVALAASSAHVRADPWSLGEALRLPDWVSLSVQHRVRYETLDNQFRANGRGGDQLLALQTLAALEAGSRAARVGFEMIDARAGLDDAGTSLDTTQVGAADLLQAYARLRLQRTLGHAVASQFTLGRQTIDFGSRRLVARNRFRNTINTFTGIDWQAAATAGWSAEAFVGSPVTRRPSARRALAADDAAFDEEDGGTLLWLLGFRSAPLAGLLAGARAEAYVIGLDESDERFDTRNRRLMTPGLRLFRDPAAGAIDYQLEAALQAGRSRLDERPGTVVDLDHLAHYEAAHIGYTFDAPMAPRVALSFDHASGDRDPRDGDNERFDTLFGARRFDYGPTGIWGAFQRSNMLSPGARANLAPTATVRAMASYRAVWLASARDQWVPTRVADPDGDAGRFIGHQVEFSVSWALVPSHVLAELGGVYFDGGAVPADAPNAGRDGPDSSYLYSQLTFNF